MGVKKLQKSGYRLLEGVLIPAGHAAQVNPRGNVRLEIAPPQLGENLSHIVCEEPISGGVVLRANLRHFPAWEIGVDAVKERRILQLDRKHLEEMPAR